MNQKHRPFWLPASNYYILAVAVTAAFFFIVWGIMSESGDPMPWNTAGISSSILLIGAVVLREIIMRRAARRKFMQQNRQRAAGSNPHHQHREKLTLEQNNYILHEIRKKSDAANILGKMAEGHREVFELCAHYLNRNEIELRTVGPNSPRLAALLKSRSTVSEYHRHHMLRWAEISSQSLAAAAGSLDDPRERVTAAKEAIAVMDIALTSYPGENALIQTQGLLQEMVVSIKVADWFHQAQSAAGEGDYSQARSLLREALFYLGRDNVQTEQRRIAASRIQDELERLRTADDVK